MPRQTSSSSASAEAREFEAIRFLDELPGNLGGVLVGGYAVSAYGPGRFSDDVDLVFPSDHDSQVLLWLKESGIAARRTLVTSGAQAALSKLRISRGRLSGDFYFGGLRARETGSVVGFDWIAQRHRKVALLLLTGRLKSKVAVARPEALWVLKLLAGRKQDIGDLFSIAEEPVDATEVRDKLSEYDSPVEREFLMRGREAVDRQVGYADALSRRGLGSPKLPRNVKLWNRFRAIIDEVIPGVSGQ